MAEEVLNQALHRAVDLVGGQTALAKLIGVKQQLIWSWLYRTGKPMGEYCGAIEQATRGRVTRYELWPDVFGPAPLPRRRARARRNPDEEAVPA